MKIVEALKSLINSFRRKPTISRQRRASTVRLGVEELEPIIAPAQDTWVASSAAFWATAGSWNTVPGPNAVPGNGYTAILDGSASNTNSTVNGAFSIDRLEVNSSYTGILSIPTAGTDSITTTNYVTNGGIVRVFSTALVGTQGSFYLTDGSIEVAAGSALTINAVGGFDDGGAIFVGGGLFINTDTFDLGSTKQILVGPGAVLSINAGSTGTINIDGNIVLNGGILVLTAQIIEIGPTGSISAGAVGSGGGVVPTAPSATTAINVGDYMDVTGTLTTSTGTLLGPSGIATAISGLSPSQKVGVVFINSNSLSVATGGSLAVGADSDIEVTDTATIAGEFSISGGTASFEELELDGATIQVTGEMDYPASIIVNSALTVDADSTITIQDYDSVLEVDGTLTIDGTVNVKAGGIVTNDNDLTVSGGMTPGVLNLFDGGVIDVGSGLVDVAGELNAGFYGPGSGTPLIDGDLEVSGTLSIADTQTELTVQGDYTQTSDGTFNTHLGGIIAAWGASLNGSLNVGTSSVSSAVLDYAMAV